MKINKKELEKELKILGKVVSGRQHLLILENVLMTFMMGDSRDSEGLIMQGTNLDIFYTGILGSCNRKYRIKAGSPQILIPINKLKRAVKAVPKKTTEINLEIITNDNNKRLLVNDTITIMNGGDLEDYPDRPKLPWGRSCDLMIYQKLTQINNVIGSDPDDKRPYVHHLLFDTEKGKLVATDGNQMRVVGIPQAPIKPFMIHSKVVDLLLSSQLKNEIGKVSIKKGYVFIQTDHGFIVARLLEEFDYPNYMNVLDYNNHDLDGILATHDKQLMIDVLKEATAITTPDYRGVTLNLNKHIVVEATNPEIGEFKKDVSNDFCYTGIDVCFTYNPKYLINTCNALPDTGLNMRFIQDQAGMILINSVTNDFKAVIMPMRMN